MVALPRATLFAGLVGLAACSGSIGGTSDAPSSPGTQTPGTGGRPGTTPGGSSEPPPVVMTAPPPAGASAGAMPFLRLTREQYEYTILDLLGVPQASAPLPANGKNDVGFAAGGAASTVEVSAWAEAAEMVTQAVQAVKGKLTQLVPCDAAKAGGEAGCATQFIRTFGRRAFRRPVLAEEEADLKALYDKGRASMGLDHAGGIGLLLEAMLQAPSFLYRWELGPRVASGALVRLNDHELASRLSYFLWSSMPDGPLFMAADAGKLTNAAEVEAQARRMLQDKTRMRRTLEAFTLGWLGLMDLSGVTKNATKFPRFSPELRDALARESVEFVNGVMMDGDGKLSTLLTAPYSYLNGPVATFYGVFGVTGDQFRKVMMPAGQRLGLLTHAGLLAHGAGPAFPSPTRRGHVIRERILCQTVPPPPPGVETNLPPPRMGNAVGVREQYEEHAKNAACAACHSKLDPLGYAFLRYDATGAWDTTPGINTTGQLTDTGPSDGAFTDGVDLAKRLAGSAEVGSCMVKQMFRFALGRHETDADAAALESARMAFESSGQDLRELMIRVVTSPAFLYRSTVEATR